MVLCAFAHSIESKSLGFFGESREDVWDEV